MVFSEFINKMASKCDLVVDNENDMNIPEEYNTLVDSVIDIMKTKIHRVDKISLPFIEAAFDDIKNIEKVNQPTAIPDGVVNKLTKSLYNKTVTQLSTDEQNIIKVLIAYICLQIN